MSKEYHYLVSGLPDLIFDDAKLPINLLEFRELLHAGLTVDDFRLIAMYFFRFDNQNVLDKLLNPDRKLNNYANFSETELEEVFEGVKDGSVNMRELGAPDYLAQFIQAYKGDTRIIEGKSWELQLSELYYNYLDSTKNSFIRKWFRFESDLNNIITAAKCRKHEIPVENQLIGNNELAITLARSNARDFGIESDFPLLNQILKALEEEDLKEFEKKLDRIKWDFLDEEVFFYFFSVERLFSYLVKLAIVERWNELDKETGEAFFNELLSNMEASYEFPEEFKLKNK